MIHITTETGSQYELDAPARKIRRLSGEHDPTPRQDQDMKWKEYLDIPLIKIGYSMLITWYIEDKIHKATETSRLVSIECDTEIEHDMYVTE
jgi:hypothetical protein